MATTKIRSSSIEDGQVSNADLSATIGVTGGQIADNAVTLAKMAGGIDGNLITYDASGDPAYVATGAATEVLTSNGAGAAPTFQAAAGGSNVPQFNVYMSATIAVTDDAWTIIPLDTADINDDGASGTCFNLTASGTNPYGFTVPAGQAGKYCLSFYVQEYTIGTAMNNCYATMYWATDGGTPANKWGYSTVNIGTANYVPQSVTTIADLAVGDNVYLYGRISTGTTHGRITGGSLWTRFSGFKLL